MVTLLSSLGSIGGRYIRNVTLLTIRSNLIGQRQLVRLLGSLINSRKGLGEKGRLVGQERLLYMEGLSPNKEGALPNKIGVIPNKEGALPHKIGVIPNKEGALPNKEEKLPNKEGALPNKEKKHPNKEGVIPKKVKKRGKRGKRKGTPSLSAVDLDPNVPLKMYHTLPANATLNPEGKTLSPLYHAGRPVKYVGVHYITTKDKVNVMVGSLLVCKVVLGEMDRAALIHDIYTTILKERKEIRSVIRTNWEEHGLPRPSQCDDPRWIKDACDWLALASKEIRVKSNPYSHVFFCSPNYERGMRCHWTAIYHDNDSKRICLGYHESALHAALYLDINVRASSLHKVQKLKLLNFKDQSDYLTVSEAQEAYDMGYGLKGVESRQRGRTKAGLETGDKTRKISYGAILRCNTKERKLSGPYKTIKVFSTLFDAARAYDERMLAQWALLSNPIIPYPYTTFPPTDYGLPIQPRPTVVWDKSRVLYTKNAPMDWSVL